MSVGDNLCVNTVDNTQVDKHAESNSMLVVIRLRIKY